MSHRLRKQPEPSWKKAFRDTLPVGFGYVPLGAAFGVLFSGLGYDWQYAGLMGLLVFAGAAQFMAIGLISAEADLAAVMVSTLIINSRHIFYGISLIDKYKQPLLTRAYLIFGLTDETYSLVTSTQHTAAVGYRYYFYVTAFNQLYWILGCFVGAFLGNHFDLKIPGLEFALVALFVTLTIEQFKSIRSTWLLVTALIVAVVALVYVPHFMLISSILMSCLILAFYGKTQKWNLKTSIL